MKGIKPILCIGRINGVLTVETRRWLWKPMQPMLARRSRNGALRLLFYHSSGHGWAVRLGTRRWLTRRGVHA